MLKETDTLLAAAAAAPDSREAARAARGLPAPPLRLGTGGALRATWRLLAVLGTTAWLLAGLLLRRLGKAPAAQAALGARYRHAWAVRAQRLLGLRVAVEGAAPPQGALLVVANHRSYADPIPAIGVLNCTLLAKAEVRRLPIIGLGAAAVGILFVRRGQARSRAEAQAAIREGLRQGLAVGLYPEGTTVPGPGAHSFAPGAFRAALEAGAPVLPVCIEYGRASDGWTTGEGMVRHYFRVFSQKKVEVRLRLGPLLAPEPAPPAGAEAQEEAASLLAARAWAWVDGASRALWRP